MRRVRAIAFSVTLGFLVAPSFAVVLGFMDDFSTPGTHGWSTLNGTSNPGTGGVNGAGDGYLLISSDIVFNFGAYNAEPAYQGDWLAAGIGQVSFYLNDVNTDEAFFFHFLLSGGPPWREFTTWQCDTGCEPPNGSWAPYTADLTTGGVGWTRIRGDATFDEVLQYVDRAHFRHDLPPYTQYPDGISGDLGIDNIALRPAPTPGDLDCDGYIDFDDIDPFVLALSDPVAYQAAYPNCNYLNGDCDNDGDVDFDDINAFVALLSGA